MSIRLDFSHERELGIDELVRRVEAYYKDADFVILRKAYAFAARAHKDQKRSSGEEYIVHPINVAAALVKLKMDLDSIIAGLLHDVVEDCDIPEEELANEFSPAIMQIVTGLTKISKIQFKTKEEGQIENFRKMVVAMAKDIRVIIVKLADRMHNMKTLQYVSSKRQRKIAKETLEIYVPLASRLGINSIKSELEDLCLRFLEPEMYYQLAERVAMKRTDRDVYIGETVQLIHHRLEEYSLTAEVKGRPKHFFSIYKKMIARGVEFEQIQDILAFRIVVNNITECYKCLGIIHSSFTPIPGRFKDYIAIPKVNGYQSLHTTVIGPKAERIEIQIRTSEMDIIAETGVAAHWKYKEGVGSISGKKLDWIQELLEYNKNMESNYEFMDAVKGDLDVGGVFVFTPKGDVRELSHGATPLDFAYAVHTEVGNHCVGAKVNGKIVSLKYRLKSGDTVDILTSKTQTPSKDWMKIVKSSRAKSKIRQWLLKVDREKNREIGEKILEKAFRVIGISIKNIPKHQELPRVIKELKLKGLEDVYISVGSGKIPAKNVILKFENISEEEKGEEIKEIDTYFTQLTNTARKSSRSDNAVLVDGVDDILVRMAKCCNPIPGDDIVGRITTGRGITVHTIVCERLIESSIGARTISVEWNQNFLFKHTVNIRVTVVDKPGILAKISKTINNIGINIRGANVKSLPDSTGYFIFELEVKDYSELLKAIGVIEKLEEVIEVQRA